MKAQEVLRRYEAGERDFRGVSLRGQSFKGKNLSGADFSEADIRGANFTHAYLKDAKFCGAKAGLQRRWATTLAIVSLMLCTLTAFITALGGWIAVGNIVDSRYILPSIIITLTAIYYFTVHHNLQTAFLITLFALIIPAVIAWVIGKESDIWLFIPLAYGASGILFEIAFGAFSGAAFSAIANTRFGAVFGTTFGAVVLIVTVFFAKNWFFRTWTENSFDTVIQIVAVVVIGTLLSNYVSWQALAGDEKYTFIRTTTITFAAFEGTSFRDANLTDADFTSASLKSTDFRGAILTRTCWQKAQKLDRIRPGTTYLQDAKLRQLLITGQRKEPNFDRQNLRGVNLQGANLADASFIGADLSEANLQDADLSRAKLVQTQLDEADLTGATLTGAFIEDWGITSHTQLQGIRCRYVFMRLPTEDNPNPRRKPDNWDEEFEDGDFADFIKPIVDTLDLYHNQGVDPRAIAISFKQLAENHPEAELEIVAMEKRGEDKFLLRAATAPESDRSALSAEYFTTYNHIKALTEAEVQALLAEKDSQISWLRNTVENMTQTALQRPSFYAQTYNNKGDTMSNAPKKYTKNDFRGASFAGGFVDADTVYAQQIGGNINNYPPEQRQNLADAAAEIQQLLQQLEQSYPNASEIEKQSALAVTLQQEIKQNPTFKARLNNALKEGGIEALKVLFAPIGIPIEMVRGWIEAEAE